MPAPLDPIVLNGSHGEGGGALLRTAVAMSCLTQQPLLLHNVRGAMRKKGLNSEDLTFIDALGDSTRAEVEGAGIDSEALVFRPKSLPTKLIGRYDIHSHEKGKVPGCSLVVLTSLLPILARASGFSELSVLGETHNDNTVGFDAFERATLAGFRKLGLYATAQLVGAGFGFGAHGEVAVEIEPSVLNPVEWASRGGLASVGAIVSTGDMPESVGEAAIAAVQELGKKHGFEVECELAAFESRSKGATVTVWAEFEHGLGCGSAALGREGVIEEVAGLAFHRFTEWFDSTATVDAYLADQLLLAAVQAPGKSVFTTPFVTRRLLTMAWVVRQFLPIHITVLGREGEPGTVTIER